MSVSRLYQRTIRPSALRSGSPRDWNQRYTPSARPQTVLNFVCRPGFERTSPRGHHARKIIRMNGIRRPPLFQLLECSAEVIQDLSVDVLDLTFRSHEGNKAGYGLDNQTKTVVSWVIHCKPPHRYESHLWNFTGK